MDPVLTEIMKNRFTAMAEEASTVAYRTAHTTFVKQTQDFQVALARPTGEFFAYPTMTGVTSGSGQSASGLIDAFATAELEPGDVLVSNDPFRTAGLVTHIMDIHLVRPIFVGGELICFAWSFVHASDVGGAVPGSISPDLTEVYQEGLRIRPMKLLRAGKPNADVIDILRDNSRIGDAVWGDLEALMAAMRLLDRRVNELCAKVGLSAFRQGMEDVLAYSERKAREVIASLRDGTYEFADYIEAGANDEAVLLHCRLTIKGEEAEIDYSGSAPQVQAALNFFTGNRTHPFLCLGLTNYIQTVAPSIPINGGILRPIRAHAPAGTVINAEFPSASGNRWVAAMRTYDTLIGCLNQAIEGGIAACGAGQAGIIFASWRDSASGRNRVSVVEPFSGGSGGRVKGDGVDANDTMIGYLKSTPIEHVEVETPLVVRRHELISERLGHGRFRGGAAVRIELECRAPEAKITVRGLDRFRFQPWGICGGEPGHNGRTFVIRRDGSQEEIGRIKVLTLRQGDRLVMESPSGGGFGDAFMRDPERVWRDVRDGFLAEDAARSAYGVEIIDGKLDLEATRALREGRNTAPHEDVAHGPERRRYEESWPVATSVAFANELLQMPIGLRPILGELCRADLEGVASPIAPEIAINAVRRRAAEFGGA
jgi:N-methylhydantoinase B